MKLDEDKYAFPAMVSFERLLIGRRHSQLAMQGFSFQVLTLDSGCDLQPNFHTDNKKWRPIEISEMVRIWEVVVVVVVVVVEEENVDQGLFYSRGARDFYWETVCCLQFNLVFLGSNWNMQNLAKQNISGYWKPSLVLFHKSEDGCIAWKETAAVSFIETGRGGRSLRGMKLTFALGTISVCIKLREVLKASRVYFAQNRQKSDISGRSITLVFAMNMGDGTKCKTCFRI